MPDWSFDGPAKVIKEPVGTGDTTWDLERDIYSAWKRWVENGSGPGFLPAFSVEGGTPIGATGLFTGSTTILINGWKLMTADHDHQALVVGNLYSDDGVVSTPNPVGNSTLFVSGTVGAQGISTGSALTTAQAAQLEEVHRRFDLDAATPNTYADDGSSIANSDFTLTKTDNGNGTFDISRT